MDKISREILKRLVSQNRSDELFDILTSFLKNYLKVRKEKSVLDIYNSILVISASYKQLIHENLIGIIDKKDLLREINKINYSLILLIDQIPKYIFDKTFVDKNTSPRKEVNDKNKKFKYDIFLGFSMKNLPEARKIVDELRTYNLEVFFAEEALKLGIGNSFFQKIDEAISQSQHFLLLCTPDAMKSEWVKMEYETFFNEFYITSKAEQRFIILQGKKFKISLVPTLLRSLQFAKNSTELINIFELQKEIKVNKSKVILRGFLKWMKAKSLSVIYKIQSLKSSLKVHLIKNLNLFKRVNKLRNKLWIVGSSLIILFIVINTIKFIDINYKNEAKITPINLKNDYDLSLKDSLVIFISKADEIIKNPKSIDKEEYLALIEKIENISNEIENDEIGQKYLMILKDLEEIIFIPEIIGISTICERDKEDSRIYVKVSLFFDCELSEEREKKIRSSSDFDVDFSSNNGLLLINSNGLFTFKHKYNRLKNLCSLKITRRDKHSIKLEFPEPYLTKRGKQMKESFFKGKDGYTIAEFKVYHKHSWEK